MYLGTTEIIGGPKDGQIEHASFVIDVKHLISMFDDVHRFEWYSLSNENDDRFNEATRSVLSIHGKINDTAFVQLELLACPPKFVGPGVRREAS